ncbi:hypothetical protein K525DRAFT_213618, partial [Schizophyllum commune Loenen D]
MARPPGVSFLGSKATQMKVTVNSLDTDWLDIILDSGSDITLISAKALSALLNRPRVKAGQRIKLIQVTGSSVISGYVNLDLYFHTPEGPVRIDVEAYVVRGMATPLILGNDFADQYGISILREGGSTHVQFGESGRRMRVENSTTPAGIYRIRRRNRRLRAKAESASVSAAERVVIPPESCKKVRVEAHFPREIDEIYIESKLLTHGNEDEVFGAPDTLICRSHPFLQVSNFSKRPIVIARGEPLGTARNPKSWLEKSA